MKKLKSSVTVRGDGLYCPLPLSIDSYGNCLTDCHHCYFRNLNNIWDDDLKPADLDLLEKKLENGIKNKNPKSILAHLLKQKKTIRLGNKSDPFQEIENKHKVSRRIIRLLTSLDWSFVVQTRFTHNLLPIEKIILGANQEKLITIMPVLSPGLEKDWEILERGKTTPPFDRLRHAEHFINKGIPVGINGEPFIPGYHTVKDFEDTLILLKHHNIPSYNTYNFHFNAFVAKRLHAIGIDIEKIWHYNQDKEWKKILAKLLTLAKKHNIKLGCPDFVNTGADRIEPTNTCCGVDVPNPCTFNTHHFKKLKQKGIPDDIIVKTCYDHSGDYQQGIDIITGKQSNFYTLKDAGLL